LPVPRSLEKRGPQQAGYCRRRWAAYPVLYNNVHFGEARLHYELSRVARREAWEIGFHFESGDAQLNRFLLMGYRRHLFEIKDVLGESFEAEMWDKGWAKVYEVVPFEPYTAGHQAQIGQRLAEVVTCLHPIFVDLRSQAALIKR
jgi:hypothetical protein